MTEKKLTGMKRAHAAKTEKATRETAGEQKERRTAPANYLKVPPPAGREASAFLEDIEEEEEEEEREENAGGGGRGRYVPPCARGPKPPFESPQWALRHIAEYMMILPSADFLETDIKAKLIMRMGGLRVTAAYRHAENDLSVRVTTEKPEKPGAREQARALAGLLRDGEMELMRAADAGFADRARALARTLEQASRCLRRGLPISGMAPEPQDAALRMRQANVRRALQAARRAATMGGVWETERWDPLDGALYLTPAGRAATECVRLCLAATASWEAVEIFFAPGECGARALAAADANNERLSRGNAARMETDLGLEKNLAMTISALVSEPLASPAPEDEERLMALSGEITAGGTATGGGE